MYKITFYEDHRGQYPVKEFIFSLEKKTRAKIWRYIELLEQHGPNLLRPYADVVKDKIRELRILTQEGNVRILYFFFIEHNIILLHALKKKTNELSEGDIDHAKKNMMDFMTRYKQGEFNL
jgi:phage-related protein